MATKTKTKPPVPKGFPYTPDKAEQSTPAKKGKSKPPPWVKGK